MALRDVVLSRTHSAWCCQNVRARASYAISRPLDDLSGEPRTVLGADEELVLHNRSGLGLKYPGDPVPQRALDRSVGRNEFSDGGRPPHRSISDVWYTSDDARTPMRAALEVLLAYRFRIKAYPCP